MILDLFKLNGKTAVVTGANTGLGQGMCVALAEAGANVVGVARRECSETKTLVEKAGGKFYEVIADLSNLSKIDEIITKSVEAFGSVDILVNNAGVAKLETFEEMSDEVRDFHLDINIKGTWNVTKSALTCFNNNGSIINLSSVTGPMVADVGECAYATTKAALIGFTKGLAMELVTRNIRVNAIMPGYIMTPMVDGIANDSNSDDPKSVIDGIRIGIPMKRLGSIEELGELAAFLASDESSYITGQGIVIDGGSTLPETMSVGV